MTLKNSIVLINPLKEDGLISLDERREASKAFSNWVSAESYSLDRWSE